MNSINLTIVLKTLSDRTASVAVLAQGDYKKAIVRCLPKTTFLTAFSEAVAKINQKSVINLFTNRKSAEVQTCVMRENAKGNHFIFLQTGKSLENLEWLAYEIALQNGSDDVLMQDILTNA